MLHVRIANWYRARAKRDHARMTQMELEVGALLVAGAPTEVKSDEGLTPLLQACRYDAGTIVRVLIATEAEFQQVQNAQKLQPVLLAAQENSPTAFEVVADAWREKGVLASAARRPGNGYTALHFAAIADAADLIKRAGRFDEFRKSSVIDCLSSEGKTKTGALHNKRGGSQASSRHRGPDSGQPGAAHQHVGRGSDRNLLGKGKHEALFLKCLTEDSLRRFSLGVAKIRRSKLLQTVSFFLKLLPYRLNQLTIMHVDFTNS